MATDNDTIMGKPFKKVTHQEWRVVGENGGILFTASTADQSYTTWREDPRDTVEKWRQRFEEHGRKVHLEFWQSSYWVSEKEYERIDLPTADEVCGILAEGREGLSD